MQARCANRSCVSDGLFREKCAGSFWTFHSFPKQESQKERRQVGTNSWLLLRSSAGSPLQVPHWSKEVHTNILKWCLSSVWPEISGNEARSKEDAALFPIHVGLWWMWQSWFVWMCIRVKTTQCSSYINDWTSHWRGSLKAERAEPCVCLLHGLFGNETPNTPATEEESGPGWNLQGLL